MTFLQLVQLLFPERTITHRGAVYLRRFYVAGNLYAKAFAGAHTRLGRARRTLYLHCFELPDQDRAYHNHPWDVSYSLILRGGYIEQRLEPDGSVSEHYRGPGSVVKIRRNDFHRVQALVGARCWTLFLTGKLSDKGSWFFKDPDTLECTPFAEYLEKHGL